MAPPQQQLQGDEGFGRGVEPGAFRPAGSRRRQLPWAWLLLFNATLHLSFLMHIRSAYNELVCEAAGPGYTAIAPLLFRMPRYPCQSGIAGQFFFLLSRAPLVTMTFCRAALPTGTNMAVSAATMLVHTAHTVLLALAPGYRRSLSAHRAHVLAMRLLSCAAPATMSLLMPASLPRTFLVKRWLPSLPFLLAYQSMVGSLVLPLQVEVLAQAVVLSVVLLASRHMESAMPHLLSALPAGSSLARIQLQAVAAAAVSLLWAAHAQGLLGGWLATRRRRQHSAGLPPAAQAALLAAAPALARPDDDAPTQGKARARPEAGGIRRDSSSSSDLGAGSDGFTPGQASLQLALAAVRNSRRAYVPECMPAQVCIRLTGMQPEDLPLGWQDEVQRSVRAALPDWSVTGLAVRQGSICLVLNVWVPRAAAGGGDAAESSAASSLRGLTPQAWVEALGLAGTVAAAVPGGPPAAAAFDNPRFQIQINQEEEVQYVLVPPAGRGGAPTWVPVRALGPAAAQAAGPGAAGAAPLAHVDLAVSPCVTAVLQEPLAGCVAAADTGLPLQLTVTLLLRPDDRGGGAAAAFAAGGNAAGRESMTAGALASASAGGVVLRVRQLALQAGAHDYCTHHLLLAPWEAADVAAEGTSTTVTSSSSSSSAAAPAAALQCRIALPLAALGGCMGGAGSGGGCCHRLLFVEAWAGQRLMASCPVVLAPQRAGAAAAELQLLAAEVQAGRAALLCDYGMACVHLEAKAAASVGASSSSSSSSPGRPSPPLASAPPASAAAAPKAQSLLGVGNASMVCGVAACSPAMERHVLATAQALIAAAMRGGHSRLACQLWAALRAAGADGADVLRGLSQRLQCPPLAFACASGSVELVEAALAWHVDAGQEAPWLCVVALPGAAAGEPVPLVTPISLAACAALEQPRLARHALATHPAARRAWGARPLDGNGRPIESAADLAAGFGRLHGLNRLAARGPHGAVLRLAARSVERAASGAAAAWRGVLAAQRYLLPPAGCLEHEYLGYVTQQVWATQRLWCGIASCMAAFGIARESLQSGLPPLLNPLLYSRLLPLACSFVLLHLRPRFLVTRGGREALCVAALAARCACSLAVAAGLISYSPKMQHVLVSYWPDVWADGLTIAACEQVRLRVALAVRAAEFAASGLRNARNGTLAGSPWAWLQPASVYAVAVLVSALMERQHRAAFRRALAPLSAAQALLRPGEACGVTAVGVGGSVGSPPVPGGRPEAKENGVGGGKGLGLAGLSDSGGSPPAAVSSSSSSSNSSTSWGDSGGSCYAKKAV